MCASCSEALAAPVPMALVEVDAEESRLLSFILNYKAQSLLPDISVSYPSFGDLTPIILFSEHRLGQSSQ